MIETSRVAHTSRWLAFLRSVNAQPEPGLSAATSTDMPAVFLAQINNAGVDVASIRFMGHAL